MPPPPRQRTKLTNHADQPIRDGGGDSLQAGPDLASRSRRGAPASASATFPVRWIGTFATNLGQRLYEAAGGVLNAGVRGPAVLLNHCFHVLSAGAGSDAKILQVRLTEWASARRTAAEQAAQARALVEHGDVSTDDAWMIARRVAQDTGEPMAQVAHAAGLPPREEDDPARW